MTWDPMELTARKVSKALVDHRVLLVAQAILANLVHPVHLVPSDRLALLDPRYANFLLLCNCYIGIVFILTNGLYR